jgi:hypothetical protein
LHWSEHLNGEWTTHESSSFEGAGVITFDNTTLSQVSDRIVHVSKKYGLEAEELGVYIHLGGGTKQSFYLAGRNSSPAVEDGTPAPTNPYPSAPTKRANRYAGSGALQVKFDQRITTEIGQSPDLMNSIQPILGQSSGRYTLLPLNSGLGLDVPKAAYDGADDPQQVKAALERSLAETELLVKPVFCQDDQHTFFVEPDLIERTVEQVETWLEPVEPPGPGPHIDPQWWWEWLEKYLVVQEPKGPWPPDDPWGGLDKQDWLTNPGTLVLIDHQAIGAQGGVPLTFEQAGPETMVSGLTVHVNSAGAIGANEVAVLGQGLALEQVGLAAAAAGLNVVGAGGINAGLMQNVGRLASETFAAGLAGGVSAWGFGIGEARP